MDPTYELISEQILTSNQTDVIFSNIPQGYKDLVINISARSPVGLENILMQFNGSSSGYSSRHLRGSGSAAASFDQTAFGWGSTSLFTTYTDATSNTFSNAEIYIPNYSGVTNKSISATGVQETNSTTAYILATAGAWSNTSPITSIRFYGNGSSLAASSSFYLYGIKNADDGSRGYFGVAATGGDEVYTTGNGYKVHVFKNSGTLNVTSPGEVEYLIIGGGGGGGKSDGGNFGSGGGGAGGYISGGGGEASSGKPMYLFANSYSVIVGAGGTGDTSYSTGNNGSQSLLNNIVALGGGGGDVGSNTVTSSARPGASGGGGGGSLGSLSGASGTFGQGNSGGNYGVIGTGSGGGGGGAGSIGGNGASNSTNRGGTGGQGIFSSITGASIERAGGGGGGGADSRSLASGGGGAGGSGYDATTSNRMGSDGAANTGGGGGGSANTQNGGNGGSGIVIIRYRI